MFKVLGALRGLGKIQERPVVFVALIIDGEDGSKRTRDVSIERREIGKKTR